MPLSIRPATEADIPRIVEISMAAFNPATDAVSRNLLPSGKADDGAWSSDFRNWSLARKSARLKLTRGVMLVAVEDAASPDDTAGSSGGQEGRVVGYALWFRPLKEGEEDEEGAPKNRPPVAGLDMEAVTALREVMTKEEYDAFGDKGARDVWKLDSLGVDPEQQRKGIGKTLLNWGVQKAAEQGRDCYLVSTPSGLPLYESAGFETQRDVLMFGVTHKSMMKWHTQ